MGSVIVNLLGGSAISTPREAWEGRRALPRSSRYTADFGILDAICQRVHSPKADAACRFIEGGGERAVITSLDRIPDALGDTAGTRVVPGGPACGPTSGTDGSIM
jgi:hypothetical protein